MLQADLIMVGLQYQIKTNSNDNRTVHKPLCRNIKAERFAWDKYLTPQKYFGKELCVTPLHASYGQIGYTIHFPYSREPMPELEYDWELDVLTIDEMDWKEWLSQPE